MVLRTNVTPTNSIINLKKIRKRQQHPKVKINWKSKQNPISLATKPIHFPIALAIATAAVASGSRLSLK